MADANDDGLKCDDAKEMLEQGLRACFSPEGAAAIAAFLQAADIHHRDDEVHVAAIKDCHWLAKLIVEMLGKKTYGDLLNDIRL
jgi:hypothetical protein